MESPRSEAATLSKIASKPRPRRRVVLWSQLIGRAGWWKIGIITGLLVLIYWQELSRMFYIWTHDGDWSHGLLVPVYSLYFLHTRRHHLVGVTPRGSFWGLGVLTLAAFLYLISVTGPMIGYARSLSVVVSIFGVVLLVGGWQVMRVAWFPILFLMFAVPLPGQVMFNLTFPMRVIASKVAALVLRAVSDAQAHAEGVVIVVAYGADLFKLNVERACAGMRLMMAFLALGTAIAFLSERPVWHRVVMILFCLPIALLCNIIRVTATSLIHVFVGREYASGSAHTILGLSMLLVAFGLFFLISYILNNLFVEATEDEEAGAASGSSGEHA
ncbi:MAG: exosortase/archaeosortase family protein [Phycisphaerae bacterium]|nr:exosortase/archaeosortase family protein [Phycisphaerae bacterium]